MNTTVIGKWTDIFGLVIAVLAGIFFQPAQGALGAIARLLNVTLEDKRGFLFAAIVFTLSATALNTLFIVRTGLLQDTGIFHLKSPPVGGLEILRI